MVGIESEVIQRAKANRVGVLISRKRFRAPGDKVWIGGVNIPRCAAIAGISLGAIVSPAWMLGRRMKSDVSHVDSRPYRHAKSLDGAIQVLVIKRVLIVPDASIGTCHFVTDEENTVASQRWPRRWLDLIYRCTRPSFNGRFLSHGGAGLAKNERRVDSGYGVRTIGSVVIHVALVRMTLAPGAFVRDDVLRFGKIGRAKVH